MNVKDIPATGLRCEVLKGQFHSPNGGVTATCAHLYLFPYEWDVPENKRNSAVVLDYVGNSQFVRPVNPPPSGHTTYMASGAFLSTGLEAIRIHDRSESWSQYAAATR